jgi:hypothetical protein
MAEAPGPRMDGGQFASSQALVSLRKVSRSLTGGILRTLIEFRGAGIVARRPKSMQAGVR